jgi:hypothetical protein
MSENEYWQIVHTVIDGMSTTAGRARFAAGAAAVNISGGWSWFCGLDTGVDGSERGAGSPAVSSSSILSSSSSSARDSWFIVAMLGGPLVSISLSRASDSSLGSVFSWTVAARLLLGATSCSFRTWLNTSSYVENPAVDAITNEAYLRGRLSLDGSQQMHRAVEVAEIFKSDPGAGLRARARVD